MILRMVYYGIPPLRGGLRYAHAFYQYFVPNGTVRFGVVFIYTPDVPTGTILPALLGAKYW